MPNLYAPQGLDLGNGISLPSISILVAPISALWGGTAAYNVAFLLSIFLASAFLYLLAREIVPSTLGPLLAAELLVVSPYFAGHALGHLNLMWVFGLPFIGYLVARFVNGRLSKTWLVVWVALALAVTAGASTELAVTESIFFVVAILCTLIFANTRVRRAVLRALPWTALGAGLGAVLALPVVFAALAAGIPSSPGNPPADYSSDLTNVFVPTQLVQFGESRFSAIWPLWMGNPAENTAYIPASLLLFVLAYGWITRGRLSAALGTFALVALIFSFGPSLAIAGRHTIPLPWRLALDVPGLDHALPGRFSAFVFMAVLLMVAHAWSIARSKLARISIGIVVLVSFVLLIPNLKVMQFPVDARDPSFVTSGQLARTIKPGENVLVLPAGQWGPGMRWEDDLDFSFSMPTGNGGGATPPPELKSPIGWALFSRTLDFPYAKQLPNYLKKYDVSTIIVDGRYPEWNSVVESALGRSAKKVGGVWVYHLDR